MQWTGPRSASRIQRIHRIQRSSSAAFINIVRPAFFLVLQIFVSFRRQIGEKTRKMSPQCLKIAPHFPHQPMADALGLLKRTV